MEYSAYGHTFKDERTMNAYKKMKSESRKKALERVKNMSTEEKERKQIRSHFAKEAKHFGIK